MSKMSIGWHLFRRNPFFWPMLIVYPLAIFAVAREFHSYNPFQKIVILVILIFVFLYIVFFRLPIILRDVKLILFPQKSIFVDGGIEVWRLVESLKVSLRESGWDVISNAINSDFRVAIRTTKERHSIMCQIEDAHGRKRNVKLSDIFWPNKPAAIIKEFAESTHR
jgi:uncharacterized membrane protein YobD (UPF0266 family)